MLTAPYEERDGWDLNVMFVNGVLYFEEHLSEAKLREKYVTLSFPLLRNPYLPLTGTTCNRGSGCKPTLDMLSNLTALPRHRTPKPRVRRLAKLPDGVEM